MPNDLAIETETAAQVIDPQDCYVEESPREYLRQLRTARQIRKALKLCGIDTSPLEQDQEED